MNTKHIFQTEDMIFRISQVEDFWWSMTDLKGDCFNSQVNFDIPIEKLKTEEKAFENKVKNEGVFGFVLQKWNPKPDHGWEEVGLCWGFVGEYNPNIKENNHYIVEEFKNKIKELNK